MLDKILHLVPAEKRDVALAAGGMAALLTGSKLTALALFGRGAWGLEQTWRKKHPEFQGGMRERWQAAATFYAASHKDPTNRVLHKVGIPLIVGGAVGLLAMPRWSPPWVLSAGAFAGGWALNIVGHAKYEKNAPAFADDPLAFLAGPAWDLQQTLGAAARRVRS